MALLVGRRVFFREGFTTQFAEGDFGKDRDGVWWIRPPRCHLGRLEEHSITEHEDGSITVAPSILYEAGIPEKSWHGYLEHGVWREL